MTELQFISLIFGLITALLWGVGDFLAAKASKKQSPETTALWAAIIGMVAYSCLFALNQGNQPWTQTGIFYAIISGIGLELGLYTFYKALTAGPVSITSPLSSAYPLVSTFIIIAVFHGSITVLEIFGILLIVIGVLMTAGLFNSKSAERKLTMGIIYSMITILLWGATYAVLDQAVASMGWQKSMMVDMVAGLFALCVLLLCTARQKFLSSLRTSYLKDRVIVGASIAQLLGGVVFTIGLSKSHSAAVIIALSSCYPSVTMLLALKHFKERPDSVSLIGGAITIFGVGILTVI